jgi:hypothetical protein
MARTWTKKMRASVHLSKAGSRLAVDRWQAKIRRIARRLSGRLHDPRR